MIFNLFSSIPVNPKSHVRGWAIHWAECLDTVIAPKGFEMSVCNTLYWEHGVNFSGGLNLFGGVTEEVVDKIEQLLNFKGKLVSLDIPMPDYADQLGKRIGQNTCSSRLTKNLIAELKSKLDSSGTLTQSELGFTQGVIGDSHSTAYALPKSSVLRTNGLTLNGALEKNHFVKQLGLFKTMPKKLTLVAGSIDIRHHIGRQPQPADSVEQLCRKYDQIVAFIQDEYGIFVEVAATVPVEYEARKLPLTGYHRDTPFCGSMALRRKWTDYFVYLMDCNNCVVMPPAEWYSMDGEKYAKQKMELSSSVHIAPSNYRRFNWGQP